VPRSASTLAGTALARTTAFRPSLGGASGALESIRRRHALASLVLYLVVAIVIDRDAVAHLNSVCACNGASDPTQFMWAMVWWPYAILHGLNPFISHVIWVPDGANLASATSVPGAALVAAPLTAIAGPVVSYNVLTVLAPVAGAWFAYRLCLQITRAPGPSILGGFLYGFSSYELGHLIGLLHTVFIFAPPVTALLTLKRLDGSLGPRRYTALMAVTLVVQLLLSTEMLLTMTLMGAATLAVAWLLSAPEDRRRIVALLGPLVGAYAVMVIVCSPYLYYELVRGSPYAQGWGALYPADAVNFLVPTEITWLGGHAFAAVSNSFRGNLTENGAYIGLPLALIIAAYAVQSWRTRTAKIALTTLALAVLWSLGSRLTVVGDPTFRLPWFEFARLPLLDQVIPIRAMVYVALICAVIAAKWLADAGPHPVRRWALAALAVVFLLPNTGAAYPGSSITTFHRRLDEPAFFTTGLYKHYLSRDEVVLPLPYGSSGDSLLWQARTDMYFRLASGYFGKPPSVYAADPVVAQLTADAPRAAAPAQLRAFIALHQVDAVIAGRAEAGPWASVLARLGLRPVIVGDVLLWRVPPGWAD